MGKGKHIRLTDLIDAVLKLGFTIEERKFIASCIYGNANGVGVRYTVKDRGALVCYIYAAPTYHPKVQFPLLATEVAMNRQRRFLIMWNMFRVESDEVKEVRYKVDYQPIISDKWDYLVSVTSTTGKRKSEKVSGGLPVAQSVANRLKRELEEEKNDG